MSKALDAITSLPEFTIKWGHASFTVRNQSYAEAKRQCVEWAQKHGWTPPKWWQWWRWKDTRVGE